MDDKLRRHVMYEYIVIPASLQIRQLPLLQFQGTLKMIRLTSTRRDNTKHNWVVSFIAHRIVTNPAVELAFTSVAR